MALVYILILIYKVLTVALVGTVAHISFAYPAKFDAIWSWHDDGEQEPMSQICVWATIL